MSRTENIEKLYKRLYVSQEDLGFAAQFASFILKKGWHYKPWEKRGTIYLQQSAFTLSLVVSYSRPFTKSCSLPDFPERLVKYNEIEHELHERVIKLRHKVYAHSDDSSYKVKPFSIDAYPSAILGAPFFRLSQRDTERLLRMINKTMDAVGRELRKLIPQIEGVT